MQHCTVLPKQFAVRRLADGIADEILGERIVQVRPGYLRQTVYLISSNLNFLATEEHLPSYQPDRRYTLLRHLPSQLAPLAAEHPSWVRLSNLYPAEPES